MSAGDGVMGGCTGSTACGGGIGLVIERLSEALSRIEKRSQRTSERPRHERRAVAVAWRQQLLPKPSFNLRHLTALSWSIWSMRSRRRARSPAPRPFRADKSAATKLCHLRTPNKPNPI